MDAAETFKVLTVWKHDKRAKQRVCPVRREEQCILGAQRWERREGVSRKRVPKAGCVGVCFSA